MMGVRINAPYRETCPHCGCTVTAKYAWLARRRMVRHQMNVHMGWKGK